MKNKILTLIAFTIITTVSFSQNTGIGTNTPDASAKLEVLSADTGFLPPRVANVYVISNPVAGLMVFDESKKCMVFYNGLQWSGCMGKIDYFNPEICDTETDIVEVTNPISGDVWMDRNMGAAQQATSSADASAYGDLYQWGRFADGHQCRTSGTTTTLATTSFPNLDNSWDGLFIMQANDPQDWLAIEEDGLWQSINDANNPCPSGFRLPTKVDFLNEGSTWSSLDNVGAYASPIKFAAAGQRIRDNGVISGTGTVGGYWSSTIAAEEGNSYILRFDNSSAGNGYWRGRANGFSVRCIKD